ncbi:MAG: DNA polymerase domain-containing protein [Candidatus Nanoarchaeia archaeon]
MKTEFIPLDYDYFDFHGKNYIKIIGRNNSGKKICLIDSIDPYFWVILKNGTNNKKIKQLRENIEKIKIESDSRTTNVTKTELHEKKFLGNIVSAIKVFISNIKDSKEVADEIDYPEIEKKREYDLNFVTKYILEKKLKPLNWYEIEGDILTSDEIGGINNLDVDICIRIESIKESKNTSFEPKILAFDIEAEELDPNKGSALMISLVGKDFKKVLTWKQKTTKNFVEVYKNEEEMLSAFVDYVKKYDPDILTGYFSDGFDLPYLRARAEKNSIKLSLGIDNSQPSFSRGNLLTGKIKGIVHIDLLRFIKNAYSQYLQSETLSLNEVAGELLGEKKLDFDAFNAMKSKSINWDDFYEYNLQDSVLTYKLAEKLWPDMLAFVKITNEPLFDVSRNTMASNFEDFVIHNLERFNEIAEKRPHEKEISQRRSEERYEGAFVFRPTPGLYENIGFFDFSSMYGSVIVSYNLSKSTLTNKKEDSYIGEYRNKEVYFKKEKGFIPLLLNEIIEKRREYKEEYKKNPSPLAYARSNAYKLIANAAYGYQGFFGARYYCIEAASSTAYFARVHIKEAIDNFEKNGFKVVYSDSVDGKTKVIIKEKEKISEINIEDLYIKTDSKNELEKEYNFKKNIEVLTLTDQGNSVFKPINYVIRHKSNKKMYRVQFTNNWYIDVTEDHSLMGYQAYKFNASKINKQNPLKKIIEIKPNEIKKKANTIICLKKIPLQDIHSKNYEKEVYEFMGYFIGDGSFHRNKKHQKYNKDYYIGLSLGLDKEELFERLIKPLIKLEYLKSHWRSKTRPGDIRFNGKLVNIISENCRKENKKIIPDCILQEKEENINAFLRGLFSADGCVMIRNNTPIIKFTTIYPEYAQEVRKLLYRVGISHSMFKENNINKYKTKNKIYSSGSQSINILIKNKEVFAEKIGFLINRKNKLANIKTKNNQKKSIANFEFDIQGVKKIEEITTPEYVYDLEVDDTHTFFANYVLAHNTDSVAITLAEKKEKDALEVLKKINKDLPGIMSLDLEDFYKRGIWVTKRTGEFGAKKKYALIDKKDQIKIRGFETVRRDWCDLARETQNKVLQFILKEGNEISALEYTQNIIKKIKERKIELKELIIKTQLKKAIEEYKSVAPHVTIAKKMRELNLPVDIGMLIEYYIAEPESNQKTKSGKTKALIRERARLPQEKGEYDIEYYLNNQILPAVENIFEVFNVNIKEMLEKKQQKKLFEF